ncbi:hypothetical protein KDM41_08670 [bacterium]|nr:hypothetical protein [bacterium]
MGGWSNTNSTSRTALAVLLLLAGAAASARAGDERPAARTVAPVLLDLAGPLADPRAEVSGMTWKGDTLVVLPQDPTLFAGAGQLGFFVMTRTQLLAALDDPAARPLTARQVNCLAPGLSRIVKGFDGLEAMGLLGDRCYLTVEAGDETGMAGYLACGRYDVVNDEVVIDMTKLTSIPLGLNIPNVAEETIVVADGQVITISEANGRNVNPHPVAKVFSPELEFLVTIPMPPVEYRVTDATAVDDEGRFWVVNYFWPPEREKLRPADDPEPPPPGGYDLDRCIERLLELRLVRTCVRGDYIERTETPPVYLEPAADGVCRNWEAIVRLGDRGFLLMTDKYPGTLLAFVPYAFPPPSKEK